MRKQIPIFEIASVVLMVLAVGTPSAFPSDAVCPGLLRTVTINEPSMFQVIAAAGDLAITGDTHGLTTWDLRDPSFPKRLGSFAFHRGQTDLYVGNQVDAYLHPSGTFRCQALGT